MAAQEQQEQDFKLELASKVSCCCRHNRQGAALQARRAHCIHRLLPRTEIPVSAETCSRGAQGQAEG